jgi:hypothetical protein
MTGPVFVCGMGVVSDPPGVFLAFVAGQEMILLHILPGQRCVVGCMVTRSLPSENGKIKMVSMSASIIGWPCSQSERVIFTVVERKWLILPIPSTSKESELSRRRDNSKFPISATSRKLDVIDQATNFIAK